MEAFLGEGSYGVVIQGSLNNQSYALKILPTLDETLENSPHLCKEIGLEAEILKNILHPNIPHFVEMIHDKEFICIVQEYIEGYPLSYYLMNGYRFTESEVKNVIAKALSILKYLHTQESNKRPIVHRDLRLSNLVLNKEQIFLIDFGLARFLDMGKSSIVKKNDNKNYQYLRKEISPQSDLFGVGIVAVDLFTNWVEDEVLFDQPWENVLPLSKDFIGFVRRLLNEDEPFTSASEALDELLKLS